MAWCPFAVKKPIAKTRGNITPRAIILHTAVSGAESLFGYFSGVGDDSHFYITPSGGIEQYVDTTKQAFANRNANTFAISIESADKRDPANNPWTSAQLSAILRLNDWLAATHPTIPRKQIESVTGSGIGWHAMFGAPSAWTSSVGKTCPGAPRIAQCKSTVIPQFINRSNQSQTSAPAELAHREDRHMLAPAAGDDYIVVPCNGKSRIYIGTGYGRTVNIIKATKLGETPRDRAGGQYLGDFSGVVDSDRPGPIELGTNACVAVVVRYSADHPFTIWCDN